MRYLIPLLVLAACNVQSDDTFDPNDMSTWEEVEAVDRQAPPDPLTIETPRTAPEGGYMEVEITAGGLPYEPVLLGASTGGDGGGPCYGYYGGNCFDIATPVRNAGYGYTDEDGDLTFNLRVPSGTGGMDVCLQAAIRRGPGGADSAISNTICWTVQLDSDEDNIGDDDEIAMGLDPFDKDTDNDFYWDGDDCAPLDPELNATCGQLYAALSRARSTGYYSIDQDDGTSELIWNNGNYYSSMAWDGDRLLAMTGQFGHSIHELDPETGDIIESYYTGGYYSGMTADGDGNVYYSEGCSLYQVAPGDSVSAGSYIGSAPCNSAGLMTDGDGNGWYVQYGDYGTLDLGGGGYSYVGALSGLSDGDLGAADKVSGAACSDDTCFILNGGWNSATTDLFEFDTGSGDLTFIGTMPQYVDALVIAP